MESFLVNAERLNPIIEALIKRGSVPEKVNDQLFKAIGFDNPSDLLVIHIFKELNIVNSDNSPSPLFEKLINKETSRSAIAEGTVHAYGKLFEHYPLIYKDSTDEIEQKIAELFEGKKTELIIKYMANTFKKLVDYAGTSEIKKALDGELVSEPSSEQIGDGEIADDSEIVDSSNEDSEIVNSDELESADTESSASQEDTSPEEPESEDSLLGQNLNGLPSSFVEEINDEESDPAQMETEQNDHTLENFSESLDTPKMDQDKKVQKAYLKKSDLLYKLDRYEELLPTLTEIIKHFDDSTEQTFQEAVNRSIIRRAIILKKLGRTDELIPALNEVIQRFETSANENYFSAASMAMLDKAELLENKGEPQTLLELYEKIVNRLQEDSSEPIASKVDQVFLNRIDLLYQFGDDDQTLHALDQTIARFENSDRADVDDFMKDALFKKAEILEQLNRDEEALEAYNDFIEKFGEKTNA